MSPSKKANQAKVEKLKSLKVEKSLEKEQPAYFQTFKSSTLSTAILRALSIIAVVGITIYIYSIREQAQDFARYGYSGIFLIALMANATVFLPAPGIAVVFAMGSVFHPIGVALAAGTGGALGELSGYLAGFSGQAVVEQTKVYEKINPWINKYGGWAILVLSAIPNPFFDIAGIAAGIAKMPLWKFLLYCWIGQSIKMAIFAYAGAYSINWLERFF
ncbi:MAG: VTT domain-containing protein [Chloroflexi bacterium]|nr:VTT domain-containing protein [Chloroflexota bacterium]